MGEHELLHLRTDIGRALLGIRAVERRQQLVDVVALVSSAGVALRQGVLDVDVALVAPRDRAESVGTLKLQELRLGGVGTLELLVPLRQRGVRVADPLGHRVERR